MTRTAAQETGKCYAARREIEAECKPVYSFSEFFWAMREEHLTKRTYTFTESVSENVDTTGRRIYRVYI